MISHPITPSDELHLGRCDFGVEVVGEDVLVPPELGQRLSRLGAMTAEEFVTILHTFPTSVAAELHWSPHEVLSARANLIERLRGTVADEILEPQRAPKRVYGAFPPSSR